MDIEDWIIIYENAMRLSEKLGCKWNILMRDFVRVLGEEGFVILSKEEYENMCGGEKNGEKMRD